MTALVSLVFVAMIPIDCKITKFSLHLWYKKIYIAQYYPLRAVKNQDEYHNIQYKPIAAKTILLKLQEPPSQIQLQWADLNHLMYAS